VNIITLSQDKECTDSQETLYDQSAQTTLGQRQSSFDRLREATINEVREQLLSSKPGRIASSKRSSRSALRAAMLVPALVGTSVISAPSSPMGERLDPISSGDTISSYENISGNENGIMLRRNSWHGS